MSAPLVIAEQAIAAFVLHALWQMPLLAGATALAIRLGRPQPRLAHALWATTLLLCVLIPVGATVTARRAALEAERNAAVGVSISAADYDGPLPAMERKAAWRRVLDQHLNARDGLRPFAFALPANMARTVAAIYLLLALCLAWRLAAAWVRARRLVSTAQPLPEASAVHAALQRQCEALHLRVPRVRLSAGVAGPALAGTLRPTLLLPPDAADMTGPEIEAVLAHELAHLRRHDPPIHLACSLLLVSAGFHPVALWVAWRVRQTREMACDAEAAGSVGSVTQYARALLLVAERTGADGGRAVGLGLFQNGLGLFNTGLGLFPNSLELTGGAMEERMQMMMSTGTSGSKAGRAVRWSACVAIGATALLAAAMVQVQPALAQQTPVVTVHESDSSGAEDQSRLLSGGHAQDQLRRAQRDLRAAEGKATTDEERNKLATARAVAAAAERELAAAGTHDDMDLNIDLHRLQALNINPNVKVQLDALKELKIDPEMRVQVEKLKDFKIDPKVKITIGKLQKMDLDAFRINAEAQSVNADRIRAEVESPEFQAKIRAQVEAVRKLDRAQINAMVIDARRHADIVAQVSRQQRQIDEANSLIARNEMPVPNPAVTATPTPAPAPAAMQTGKPLKVDASKMAGNKINGMNPVYPQSAKDAKISGAVVLHAIIDETGKVEAVQVVSSPDASLSKSSIEAVQQWTYKPYLLNGNPIPVDTTITVNFSLSE
jgi:TonB family protein